MAASDPSLPSLPRHAVTADAWRLRYSWIVVEQVDPNDALPVFLVTDPPAIRMVNSWKRHPSRCNARTSARNAAITPGQQVATEYGWTVRTVVVKRSYRYDDRMKKYGAVFVLLLLSACDQRASTHGAITAAVRRCVDSGMTAAARSSGGDWTVTCHTKGVASH